MFARPRRSSVWGWLVASTRWLMLVLLANLPARAALGCDCQVLTLFGGAGETSVASAHARDTDGCPDNSDTVDANIDDANTNAPEHERDAPEGNSDCPCPLPCAGGRTGACGYVAIAQHNFLVTFALSSEATAGAIGPSTQPASGAQVEIFHVPRRT